MARDMTDSSPLRRPLRLTRSQAKLNTSDDDTDEPATGSGDSPFNLKLASDTFLLDGNDSFDAQMAAAINDSPLKASRRAPSPKKTIGKPKFSFRQPSNQTSTDVVEVAPPLAPVPNAPTHKLAYNGGEPESNDMNSTEELLPMAVSTPGTLPEGRGPRRKTSSLIHPPNPAPVEPTERIEPVHPSVQQEPIAKHMSGPATDYDSRQTTTAPQLPSAVSQSTQPQRRVIRLRRNEPPQVLVSAAPVIQATENPKKTTMPPPTAVPSRSLRPNPFTTTPTAVHEIPFTPNVDTPLANTQETAAISSPEDLAPIIAKVASPPEYLENEPVAPAASSTSLQDENTQTADCEPVQEVVPPPRVAAHVPKRMRVVSAATKPPTLKRAHTATEELGATKENAAKAPIPIKRPKLDAPPVKAQVKLTERGRAQAPMTLAPRSRTVSGLAIEAKKPARAVKPALPEEARRAPLRERPQVRAAPVVPEKQLRKPTVPHAFTFESDRRLELHKEHPAHKENQPAPKPVIVFKPAHHPANVARPTESSIAHAIAQLSVPKPKVSSKQPQSHLVSGFKPTVPQAPNFATDARMKEREAFDESVRIKEEEKRIAEESRKEEEEQRAEEEVRELRRLMDEHARANVHPVPQWYDERHELLEAKKA